MNKNKKKILFDYVYEQTCYVVFVSDKLHFLTKCEPDAKSCGINHFQKKFNRFQFVQPMQVTSLHIHPSQISNENLPRNISARN